MISGFRYWNERDLCVNSPVKLRTAAVESVVSELNGVTFKLVSVTLKRLKESFLIRVSREHHLFVCALDRENERKHVWVARLVGGIRNVIEFYLDRVKRYILTRFGNMMYSAEP